MKNIIILGALVFIISCGQQEKSITDGIIVDSLQPKKTLAINVADTLVDSSKLIIPGISIGQVHLNERADSIILKLGKPDMSDAAMGKSVSIYKNKENNTVFKIYYVTNMGAANEAPRAKLFHTNSSFFSTASNISIGSSLETIKKVFPDLKRLAIITIGKDTFQLYDAEKQGITFEMDKENICKGISLHTAGEQLEPTYLAFYDSFNFVKE